MKNEIDLRRIALLFEKGAVYPAMDTALKSLEGDVEFEFEKFDESFEKLIEQEEWDVNDSLRLCSLFFARAVEMKYMEENDLGDSDESEETDEI